jgi:hypothetical protein
MLAALADEDGLRGGEVILMHDALGPGARREDCAETVALTGALLAAAAEAGLEVGTLSTACGDPA